MGLFDRLAGVSVSVARPTRSLACVLLALCAGCSEDPIDRLRARLALKEGNLSYLRGDYRRAVEHYGRALTHVPTLHRAYLNRAYSEEALFRASDDATERAALVDSTLADYRRYLELVERSGGPEPDDPGRQQVETRIFTLLVDSGQLDGAIQELERRLQRDPRDISALAMLANLAVERGDLDLTLRSHRRRLEIEPENPEAYYGLGVVAWQYSYHDRVPPERRAELLEEGLRATLRAVELRPDYFEALVYANLLYRELAKHAGSEAKYKEYEERAKEVRAAQTNST
jgi:tetratricopeptide (TPR) repeat protein